MTYLLDTNTCIVYLNGTGVGVLKKLQGLPAEEIAVCSVVKAELFFGAQKSTRPDRTLAKQKSFLDRYISLPFDDHAAEKYGGIRARLAAQGKPIGPYDLMIAAIALANDLTLVSHNTREFGRVEGLRIQDWEAVSQ